MSNGYKPIKIKRSKNRLYKKKKTPARKAAEVVLLLVLIAGLGFLGYSVAGPVIEYLQRGAPEVDNWEPPATPDISSGTEESTVGSETGETTTPPEDAPTEQKSSVTLKPEDLTDSGTLQKALSAASKAGADKVYIPVKNSDGILLYKTALDELKGTNVDKGTIPAGQIAGMAKGQGLTPAAILPTLKDKETPSAWDDTSYRFSDDSYAWLDGRAEEGGKRWLDPYRKGTLDYLAAVSKELTDAGFTEILLTDTIYPNFLPYDEQILDGKYFTDKRTDALVKVVNRVSSSVGEGEVIVEASLKDVLAGFGQSFSGTAEVLGAMKSGKVAIVFTAADFDNSLQISENARVGLSPNIKQRVKVLYEYAEEYLPELEIIPVINSAGISEKDIEEAKNVLTEAGYGQLIIDN